MVAGSVRPEVHRRARAQPSRPVGPRWHTRTHVRKCGFDARPARAAARTENRAAGERLAVIGELDVLRLREVGERETWCTDTQDAITAEVAAALGITHGLATSYLQYSRAMRLRLPRVGALLVAGDID